MLLADNCVWSCTSGLSLACIYCRQDNVERDTIGEEHRDRRLSAEPCPEPCKSLTAPLASSSSSDNVEMDLVCEANLNGWLSPELWPEPLPSLSEFTELLSVLTAAVTCVLPALLTSHWSAPSRHAPEWSYGEMDSSIVAIIPAATRAHYTSVQTWEFGKHWSAQATGTATDHPPIKGQRPSATLCGLGGCATTLPANPVVFAMQVSKPETIFAKKSSNYALIQLLSHQICLAIITECVSVVRSLLLLSGDIETNPGPINSTTVLTELQKLSAGQDKLLE